MRGKPSVTFFVAIGLKVALTICAAGAQGYEDDLRTIATSLTASLEEANQHSSTVLDFTDLQGSPTELGRFLAQELSDKLVAASKKISVVDRANLQVLLREHNLSVEGLINPESIQKIGNLIGIDTVIVGTTTPLGDTIRLSVRAISVEKGKIVASQSMNLPATGPILALSGRVVPLTSPNEGPSPSPPASTPPGSVPGTTTKAKVTPGWVVQLRTVTWPDGKLTVDPGNVAAYTEPGPSFAIETFRDKSGLSKSRQVVLGIASAKFLAQSAGSYQFGVRVVEVPWGSACYEKLTVKDTVLSNHRVDSVAAFVEHVELSPGVHDVQLQFVCEQGLGPTTGGIITVLVAHPDELGPTPARAGEFVH